MKRLSLVIGALAALAVVLVVAVLLARGGDPEPPVETSSAPARSEDALADTSTDDQVVVPVDPDRPQTTPPGAAQDAPLIPDPPRPKRVPRWQPPATPPPPAPSAYRVHVTGGSWPDRARVDRCARSLARYILAPAGVSGRSGLASCVTSPTVLDPAEDAGGDSAPGAVSLTSLSLGVSPTTGVRTASMYFRRTPPGAPLQAGRIVFELAPDGPRVSLFRLEYF